MAIALMNSADAKNQPSKTFNIDAGKAHEALDAELLAVDCS